MQGHCVPGSGLVLVPGVVAWQCQGCRVENHICCLRTLQAGPSHMYQAPSQSNYSGAGPSHGGVPQPMAIDAQQATIHRLPGIALRVGEPGSLKIKLKISPKKRTSEKENEVTQPDRRRANLQTSPLTARSGGHITPFSARHTFDLGRIGVEDIDTEDTPILYPGEGLRDAIARRGQANTHTAAGRTGERFSLNISQRLTGARNAPTPTTAGTLYQTPLAGSATVAGASITPVSQIAPARLGLATPVGGETPFFTPIGGEGSARQLRTSRKQVAYNESPDQGSESKGASGSMDFEDSGEEEEEEQYYSD